jgi:hypothetical protein
MSNRPIMQGRYVLRHGSAVTAAHDLDGQDQARPLSFGRFSRSGSRVECSEHCNRRTGRSRGLSFKIRHLAPCNQALRPFSRGRAVRRSCRGDTCCDTDQPSRQHTISASARIGPAAGSSAASTATAGPGGAAASPSRFEGRYVLRHGSAVTAAHDLDGQDQARPLSFGRLLMW